MSFQDAESAAALYLMGILNFSPIAGATHAFTNPNATAIGEKFNIPIKYNAAADSASWKDMKDFFDTIFK